MKSFIIFTILITVTFASYAQVTTNLLSGNSTVSWTDGAYINPSTGLSTASGSYSHTDTINIDPSQEYTLKVGGYGIAWLDQSGAFISVSGSSSAPRNMRTVTSPSNAENCIVTYLTAKKSEFRMFSGSDFYQKTFVNGVEIPDGDMYFSNKRIAWYGTSIPNGHPNQSNQWEYGYPDITARLLGSDIQNYSVSGGTIRKANTSGVNVNPAQSFTNTQYITNTNYQSKIVNLIGTELEPDLFVFDYGVNDYVNDPSDIDNVSGYDFTSEDLNTFLGSYNKVLKELFTAKPTANVILLTHFSDDGVQVGSQSVKDCWKPLNDLIVSIGEYWNIPVLDLRNMSGMRNANGVENISIYAPDLIHPATDTEKKAIHQIARLCQQFILDNVATDEIVSVSVTPSPTPTPTPTTGCSGIGEYNEATAHYLLPSGVMNVWGHNYRLCGMTGGYTDGTGYFDVNGVSTTKSIAFPNGIICDLKHVTCAGDFIMYQDNMGVTSNVIYTSAQSACDSYSLGGFTDWQMISRKEFNQIAVLDSVSYSFNYPPFESTLTVGSYWTRDALYFGNDETRKWKIDQYQGISFSFENTAAARAMPTRIGNISEL